MNIQELKAKLEWLSTHNKNYTKQQYCTILECLELVEKDNSQLNFILDNNSYRLDYDKDFKSITLYQVWESADDKELFKYSIGA